MQARIAMLLMDVNDFGEINDTLGQGPATTCSVGSASWRAPCCVHMTSVRASVATSSSSCCGTAISHRRNAGDSSSKDLIGAIG